MNKQQHFTKDKGGATLLNGKIYRIPATSDFMFKNLFGMNGKEENLKGLLQVILKIKIESLNIENPELPMEYKKSKKGILDIRAKLANGTSVLIEMQVEDENNIGERAVFYLCKLYTNVLESGEQYDKLEKTIAIIITNFSYYNRKEYHQIAHLKFEDCIDANEIAEQIEDETSISKTITDKIELHIIDLKRFKQIKEPEGELADWLNLILGDEGGIDMAIRRNKTIAKINQENIKLSADKNMQEEYWFIQKNKIIENTKLSVARNAGLHEGEKIGREAGEKIGREVGRRQEKEDTARNLIKMGLTLEQIMKATGLTKKEIENLK